MPSRGQGADLALDLFTAPDISSNEMSPQLNPKVGGGEGGNQAGAANVVESAWYISVKYLVAASLEKVGWMSDWGDSSNSCLANGQKFL